MEAVTLFPLCIQLIIMGHSPLKTISKALKDTVEKTMTMLY